MELAPRVPQGDGLSGAEHDVAAFHLGIYEVKVFAVFDLDLICFTINAHHMSNHGAVLGWPHDEFDLYAYAPVLLYSSMLVLGRVRRGGRRGRCRGQHRFTKCLPIVPVAQHASDWAVPLRRAAFLGQVAPARLIASVLQAASRRRLIKTPAFVDDVPRRVAHCSSLILH